MKQVNRKLSIIVWSVTFVVVVVVAGDQNCKYSSCHSLVALYIACTLLDGAFDEPLNDNDRTDNQCVLRKLTCFAHINRMLFN